jgi:hypothetical protein
VPQGAGGGRKGGGGGNKGGADPLEAELQAFRLKAPQRRIREGEPVRRRRWRQFGRLFWLRFTYVTSVLVKKY